jgi:anhydro-N-acetylmuramic acid kinase
LKILGMISGTSHDGIDATIVDFTFDNGALSGVVRHRSSTPYGMALRSRLVAALPPAQTTLSAVCQLDTLIGQAFAEAAATAIDVDGPVDLIVSHGQTVFHWVDGGHALGTLQIGQPAWIAERTGVPVVSDVRIRDITAGGQGAPLVSLLDALLLAGQPGTTAALNLGGISNITVVRGPGDLCAYDIGPANALIDAVISQNRANPRGFDEGGRVAASGTVDEELLAVLLDDPYYRMPAPKSTGKEHFHGGYVSAAVVRSGRAPTTADLVATLTELTVRTVAAEVRAAGVDLLVVSGGGCRNPVLFAGLVDALPGVRVVRSDEFGAPADDKEAIAFALIGWCTAHGIPGNEPTGTGARGARILGTITPGCRPLELPAPLAEPLRSLCLSVSERRIRNVDFRPATMSDLERILAVFMGCWRESYAAVLPQRLVDAMTDEDARALWSRVLAEAPAGDVIVAETDEPSGATILGVARIAGGIGGVGSVQSLYVSPAAQGDGVGSRLLSTACDALAARGVTTAHLWVFTDNHASVAFYQHHGWIPDGQTRVQGEFGEPETRMVKAHARGHRLGATT